MLASIEFAGLRVLDYTADKELSSSVALITIPPGVGHPEALSERSDKYYLVIEGTVEFSLDGEAQSVGGRDLIIIRSGQRFSYTNPTKRPAILVLVHTPPFDLQAERFF